MEGFRVKKIVEKKIVQPTGTLDSIHNKFLSELTTTQQIDKLTDELHFLEDQPELDIVKISKLKSNLVELQKKNITAEKYFTKNADIMMQYYEHKPAQTKMFENSFTKFFQVENDMKPILINKYLKNIRTTTVPDIQNPQNEMCEKCGVEREEFPNESTFICPKCGSEGITLIISNFSSFKDTPQERNNYSYKKNNHFSEILNQFQAKETAIIPDELLENIKTEIKKKRITNIASISIADIDEILKKLNQSKYYEHSVHILSRLNGTPPPNIPPEISEKLYLMFQEIQTPFILYCPENRINFLSYDYVLYKFFELLELDEYKMYFTLLKSRERLIEHDEIWKKICSHLQWEFIPSI